MALADSLPYLLELRKRLLYSVVVLTLVFLAFSYYANDLYYWLAVPLLKELPTNGFIATQVTSTFLVPFKFAMILSVFICVPYLLFNFWCFIAPALYQKERRTVWILMVASSFLFYLGVAFSYFVVLPLMFRFFVSVTPLGVELRPDMGHYLDFVVRLLFAFGVSFEVPIFTWLLVKTGITTRQKLVEYRPYVIIGAFVLGMLLTPPDVISQTLLAIPIWLLFEIGLFPIFHLKEQKTR